MAKVLAFQSLGSTAVGAGADPGSAVATAAVPRLLINGRFLVQQATGVQRVAREIAAEIDALLDRGELDADVTLLVPAGRWVQELSLKHIKVETVGRSQGFVWEQLELPRHLRGDVLLSLGNSAPLRALLRRDLRVAVMIHDVSFLDFPGAYKLSYRQAHRSLLPLLLRRASHIFTVSETERGRLLKIEKGIAPRISVARNGGWSGNAVSPAEPTAPAGPRRYALYVGSLSHRKNFERILATAIRLTREDDIDFVFVGETGGILRRPGQVVPRDVAHRVQFLGQINDREHLGRIYAQASVLVFPSLYEACPLPPLEAAHFGCPVVVSNIPSMWERCGDSVTYCDPQSVDSIVRATRAVLMASALDAQISLAEQPVSRTASWAEQARIVCQTLLPHSLRSCLPESMRVA